MIEHFKAPGNPRFEAKLNGLVDGYNTFITIRGDDTFIDVQKIPGGGLKVSLNLQQVIARIPKVPSIALQEFEVVGLPNMSGGVVLPYVWAVNHTNASNGSFNIAVGVMQAHDVGDIIEALPIGAITNSGAPLQYQTSNGATGTVTYSEGDYGPVFEVGLNRSGGTNGSAGVTNTMTYIITTLEGVPLITTPQVPDAPPYVSYRTVVPATKGLARIDNDGNWFLIKAYDWNTGVACTT